METSEDKTRIEELESSNKALADYARRAAHDLKEPLRTISSFIGLLEEEIGKHATSDATLFFSLISDASSRLHDLVDGLLELAKIDSTNPEPSQVDLNLAVQGSWEALTLLTTESKAELRCARLPTVTAQPSHFFQVFLKLMSNAIKFSHVDVPVIEINADEEPTRWLISVADNGQGISTEDAERAFEDFERLHPPAEGGGAGLGLSIVKKIVTYNGGETWIEEAASGGAKFMFSIPKATSPA